MSEFVFVVSGRGGRRADAGWEVGLGRGMRRFGMGRNGRGIDVELVRGAEAGERGTTWRARERDAISDLSPGTARRLVSIN